MDSKAPATSTLAALIADAAAAEMMSKAVFSKPHDKAISRMTLTLKRVKGEIMLQMETLRVANVADTQVNGKKPVQASHENLSLADATARLSDMADQFDQINLMTTAGNCELRRSKGARRLFWAQRPSDGHWRVTVARPPSRSP